MKYVVYLGKDADNCWKNGGHRDRDRSSIAPVYLLMVLRMTNRIPERCW